MGSAYLPEGSDTMGAPWNEEDLPEKEIDVTVSVTLSKSFKISVDDYSLEEEDYGKVISCDYSSCNLKRAVEEQIYLPQNLAICTKRIFEHDAGLRGVKMPKYLRNAINDCSDWNVDDYEVVID